MSAMPSAEKPSSRPHASIFRASCCKSESDKCDERTDVARGGVVVPCVMTMPIIDERAEYLPDPTATLEAGARLARGLCGGMVFTLSGELGSGKTTLVRGMLHELGWRGSVKSPTYTLVEHYQISSLYFYHFDF